MKYDRNTWQNWSNKPKKWRFVSIGIYSNLVKVYELDEHQEIRLGNKSFVLGSIELLYKITDNKIDKDYVYNIFNRKINYYTNNFKRDRGLKPFISEIYLTKEEYIIYTRRTKLERILKNED